MHIGSRLAENSLFCCVQVVRVVVVVYLLEALEAVLMVEIVVGRGLEPLGCNLVLSLGGAKATQRVLARFDTSSVQSSKV